MKEATLVPASGKETHAYMENIQTAMGTPRPATEGICSIPEGSLQRFMATGTAANALEILLCSTTRTAPAAIYAKRRIAGIQGALVVDQPDA